MTQNIKQSSSNFKQVNFHQTEVIKAADKKNQTATQQFSQIKVNRQLHPQKTNGSTKYYNGQLFQKQIDLKKNLKVQISAHTSSEYLEMNNDSQKHRIETIEVVPKIQHCDEKLQLSIDFQYGNQKQTINFDIDILNQNQEKYCNQISSGQICSSCNQQQSQLTSQKLLEFEDSCLIQDSILRAKLRKGSCNSDLSDITLINEPSCNKYIFDQAINHQFESQGLKNQKFLNFDHCKSELSEQKSLLSTNNNNKQQLLINQTSNIFLNNNNYITPPNQNQESTNQSQFINKENPRLNQTTQNVADKNIIQKINPKCDKLIIDESLSSYQHNSNASDQKLSFSPQQSMILSQDLYSILQGQIAIELLQRPEISSHENNSLQSQFIIQTPCKNLGSQQDKTQQVKVNSTFGESNQSEIDFNDYSNIIQDIDFTKEYLAKAEKKNVVKNFVKAFKSFLNESENKDKVTQLLRMKEPKELEQFRQRFSAYLKKKKFNNKLIKDLLMNQSYSAVFEFWLLNYAQDWLFIHSKVENKDSHLIMLQYFQKCIGQPDQLDKLKVLKNPRKQSFCISSTALTSTPHETTKHNRVITQSFSGINIIEHSLNLLDSDQTQSQSKNSIAEFNILPSACSQSSIKNFD
ncbi:hypothetical protein TTHERM_00997680 (macronuclear) [Tetrahymena thermophila SB210]|uniref:Uncharacterized protein n=1 Tax=Tetrahymena thermophila (strain SB210) TaxID=312017 RepID=Q23QZ3_TETTS|nr:hypothetical protein TTHERM_00997680 [Tetrahymena thermophila SB210]EAR98963.1 hypothetical protein TTHERM_00997680 [Tetrahymena thermophila SB210]|eukprot:XP_001019208.1 hypothetical protein TTHERM_00997680 [Tetrahymena thermophila SB210]